MKSSKNTIPSQWETKRLSLSDTVIDESNALQAIYEGRMGGSRVDRQTKQTKA